MDKINVCFRLMHAHLHGKHSLAKKSLLKFILYLRTKATLSKFRPWKERVLS